MSSYHRMLVHRVAHYYGVEHRVDTTGKKVVLYKTEKSRVYVVRFSPRGAGLMFYGVYACVVVGRC